MLIDVHTTFRVDWYVFPLFTSVERSRVDVHVVVAIVVCSVRAVVKIMGYERRNKTYYLVLFISSSKNH
jgi:hypothetical protein